MTHASRRPAVRAPRGVTLLELSVSVAIGALMFVIMGTIFLAQAQFFAIEDAIAETQVSAFQAIEATGQAAVPARRVLSGRTVNGTAYVTGDSLVVLEIPAVGASGDIIVNGWDYAAVGQDPSDATKFIVDIDAYTGSERPDGKQIKATLVDKVIFRYNNASTTSATAIDVYVRMGKNARSRTIYTPLGKVYFLGSS
jgi:prepilin-type N-terminal cleavage/methylation domain-containing protein